MEDLIEDARFWLLGTDGQTKIAIIVNFTESYDGLLPLPSQPGEETEESVIAAVNVETHQLQLSKKLIALHYRGVLAKPLIGTVGATFHVFHRTGDDDIEEVFMTTVLPAPVPGATDAPPQTYALTLADLHGDCPIPDGEDPNQEFILDMEDFRVNIRRQTVYTVKGRGLDRAKEILIEKRIWAFNPTYAQDKSGKRRPDDDDEWEEEGVEVKKVK